MSPMLLLAPTYCFFISRQNIIKYGPHAIELCKRWGLTELGARYQLEYLSELIPTLNSTVHTCGSVTCCLRASPSHCLL